MSSRGSSNRLGGPSNSGQRGQRGNAVASGASSVHEVSPLENHTTNIETLRREGVRWRDYLWSANDVAVRPVEEGVDLLDELQRRRSALQGALNLWSEEHRVRINPIAQQIDRDSHLTRGERNEQALRAQERTARNEYSWAGHECSTAESWVIDLDGKIQEERNARAQAAMSQQSKASRAQIPFQRPQAPVSSSQPRPRFDQGYSVRTVSGPSNASDYPPSSRGGQTYPDATGNNPFAPQLRGAGSSARPESDRDRRSRR